MRGGGEGGRDSGGPGGETRASPTSGDADEALLLLFEVKRGREAEQSGAEPVGGGRVLRHNAMCRLRR